MAEGTWEFKPRNIKAGEAVTLTMQFNWSDANRPNDWSVVAHGDKATLSITHNGGLKSQHLPVAKASDGTAYVAPANPTIAATITPATTKPAAASTTTTTTFDMTNTDSWCNKNWETNGVNNWTEAMWDKFMDKYYKGW